MDNIATQLNNFGLDEQEINLYLLLLRRGTLTATEISQFSKIPKTTVYRLLDQLKQKKLVNEIVEENGRLFEAAPAENLKYTIIELEQKVKTLSESFPLVTDALSMMSKQDISKSKIRYYSGIEGLKQITWNCSKAKDFLRIFEIKEMSAFLNYDFCEITRKEFVKNKVFIKELTNEKGQPGYTNVLEIVKNFWEMRYVDSNELKMEFEMLVYNDVFVMYNYKEEEIFCVEIYNEKLARMQKQIFDFIWLKGKKFKVLDDHGAAELIV